MWLASIACLIDLAILNISSSKTYNIFLVTLDRFSTLITKCDDSSNIFLFSCVVILCGTDFTSIRRKKRMKVVMLEASSEAEAKARPPTASEAGSRTESRGQK